MQCALFLDPRYKCAIESDHDKIQLAKLTLEHIWERSKSVISRGSSEMEQETTIFNAKPEDNMSTFYDELDLHLSESLGLQASSTGRGSSCPIGSSRDKSSLVNAISEYERSIMGFRMKSSESIHLFWESKKKEFGQELYELACIVFAIPPTQASVERDFSAL